jgi:hypothetical protein
MIQIGGVTMDWMGGNLDDPLRLMGTVLLTPGLDLSWAWTNGQRSAPMTAAEYASLLGIAVAINLAIAAMIHASIWAVRGLIKQDDVS